MWYKNDLVTLTLNFKSKRSSNNIDVLIDHFLYKIKIHHEVEFFMIKYIFSVYWKLLLVSMYISFYVGENCYPFFFKAVHKHLVYCPTLQTVTTQKNGVRISKEICAMIVFA